MEDIKKVGFVGLGRMGLALAKRAASSGFTVLGHDPGITSSDDLALHGIHHASNLKELIQEVDACWLMIPHDRVDQVVDEINRHASTGLILIDGGNSFYKDSIRRFSACQEKGISFVDCGTSGGVHGAQLGYCLMVGGLKDVVVRLEPLLKALAIDKGYAYLGAPGAGHFVKMVHNGIEYGVLQAYAEGLHVLREGPYKQLDLSEVTELWNHGSIIRSWVCDLATQFLSKDQTLEHVSGVIGENSTGRWTAEVAKELEIPTPVIDASLKARADSRLTGGNFGSKIVAMLRNTFGGHPLGGK